VGLASGQFVTNDNNTAYNVYIEGFSLSGDYGSIGINNAIVATNFGRPEPFSISYPPANPWILLGDNITIYFNFTNYFNIPF
jgi:hypothetical protein